MWFLYLDESGDLGFDFVNKKPSKFFTVTILGISGKDVNRALINAVKRTIKRKLGRKNGERELKGAKTSLDVKKYFYEQSRNIKFNLFAVTLNKRRLYDSLARDKERIYNYVARLVLDKIPFEEAATRVELIVDKCKSKPEISDFNRYIMSSIKGRLEPKVPLTITHDLSHQNFGLQAVDLFCWGIARKYEKKDTVWLEMIKFETLYFPDARN
jgi:hypothetical protein